MKTAESFRKPRKSGNSEALELIGVLNVFELNWKRTKRKKVGQDSQCCDSCLRSVWKLQHSTPHWYWTQSCRTVLSWSNPSKNWVDICLSNEITSHPSAKSTVKNRAFLNMTYLLRWHWNDIISIKLPNIIFSSMGEVWPRHNLNGSHWRCESLTIF